MLQVIVLYFKTTKISITFLSRKWAIFLLSMKYVSPEVQALLVPMLQSLKDLEFDLYFTLLGVKSPEASRRHILILKSKKSKYFPPYFRHLILNFLVHDPFFKQII